MKKPSGILFDFGDTILHEICYEPEKGNRYLFSIIRDTSHVAYSDVLNTIAKLNDEIYPKKNARLFELSWAAFNRLVFEYFHLTIPVSPEEAELEFWKRSTVMLPAPSIGETLELITGMNIPIGIVSNSAFSGKTLEWELERHDLRGYFKFVMSSADYGLRKPHPYIFQLAASKIDAPPHEIWFFGDRLDWDVHGSRNAGMNAYHYTGNCKTTGSAGEKEAVPTITNWKELMRILEEAND